MTTATRARNTVVASRRRAGGFTVASSSLGVGAHFLSIPGTGGAFASTPSQAAFAPGTAKIDLRVKVAMVSWVPGGNSFQLAKWNAAGDSQFGLWIDNAGKLNAGYYLAGVLKSGVSTVATGFTANTAHWVRALIDPAAGTIDFYTSPDAVSWTSLGTQITGLTTGTVQTPGTPQPLTVGATAAGTGLTNGKVYAAHLLIGVAATNTVSAIDFSTQTAGTTSFAATTTETWTLQGTAAIV